MNPGAYDPIIQACEKLAKGTHLHGFDDASHGYSHILTEALEPLVRRNYLPINALVDFFKICFENEIRESMCLLRLEVSALVSFIMKGLSRQDLERCKSTLNKMAEFFTAHKKACALGHQSTVAAPSPSSTIVGLRFGCNNQRNGPSARERMTTFAEPYPHENPTPSKTF